jgi:hypothetical protein
MNTHGFIVNTLAAVSAATLPFAGFAACDASSGPNTAALVELYTSEGCSSCPPADRQLSRLRQALGPEAEVVPLAMHVGYWDYIGWKDAYAQGAFSERQSRLVQANRQKTVYTPQFFVGGTELRSWQVALPGEVRQLNKLPAASAIRVQAGLTARGALALNVDATARTGADQALLYLAIAENGLVTTVTRGENAGATLAHDHVVRTWIGPIRIAGGSVRAQREVVLPAVWNRPRLEVIAFVQDERSGRVLQALSAANCAGS